MKTRIQFLGAFAAIVLNAFGGAAQAQVNVTTYHNDNARTGQFTQETALTPANVNSSEFGKLFTTAVDGWVYAQPLYLANVSIGGSTHNVLYVVTDHDSLYAIDADNGTVYWQYSLIPTGGMTVNSQTDLNCTDIVPEVGITGTPVIDANTGTIYLVAKSKVGSTFYQYLHAIDVATAAEKFGGPINIQATVPGTASDGNGTTLSFDPRGENQRPALLLENGHVVIGWSSHCDGITWHGWVISYNASSLAQEAVYNTSPNGSSNGIWMSGDGLAADAGGNMYFATGNGTWNGTSDLGDSIVKLGPPSGGSFPVVDYFTPYNQATLAATDQDLSSGGLVLLPTLPNGQQLLVQMAKEGTIYLVDRNNMGTYCVDQTPACTNSDPNIVQELPHATVGVWGSPAYWNGYVYWGAANDLAHTPDNLKAYSFNANNSGLLSTTPSSQSANTFGFSAPVPAISANGVTNGILWGLDNSTFNSACSGGLNCQVLYAYDATNLATMLYNSSQAPNSRDIPGGAVKFATPIIANGKVYFGSQFAVSGFGLVTAKVGMSPAPGTFSTAQSVTLSDSTPGAQIYYTTDGSTPTPSSAIYSAPLQVSATTTINAIAAATGYANSALASGTYIIGFPVTTSSVNLTPAANIYGIGVDGAAVPGVGIDGGGYAYSGSLLGTSASWSGVSFTFGAAGALDAVRNATIALPAGNFSNLYMLATAINSSQPNQTFTVTYTDGTTSVFTQSLSDWFTPQNYAGESIAQTEAYRLNPDGTPDSRTFYLYGYNFAIDGAKTVKSLALPKNNNVVVLSVTLQVPAPATATVSMSPAPGNFTTAQSVTLTDSTPGARIYYTTNGLTPTTSSPVYSAPLQVSATTTINAVALAPTYSTSALASGSYTIGVPLTTTTANLASAANVFAIGIDGATVPGTGIDGGGYAYSGTLLGSTVPWAGVSFKLGAAGALDAVSNATITLPAGKFAALYMLATAVTSAQPNQTFILTYTDGTTSNLTQSVSDWFTPRNYAGESIARTESYRLNPDGTSDNRTFYLYGYSFAINSAKTVKSLALPNNTNVVVFAVALQAAPPITAPVALSPAPGTFTTTQAVTLSDSTAGARIYYTTNGTTPTTSSTVYSAPLQVSATTTINAIAAAPGYSTSVLASGTYKINPTPGITAPVALSPAPGTFTTPQAITLSDSTAGARIYYTTNGTTPTTSSAIYSTPLQVSATTTINAIAAAPGHSNSVLTSGTYKISSSSTGGVTAMVTLSPAPGTFTSAQSVTLTDSTPGARIYYTTNGTTATTSSAVYSTPLQVSATTTINAIAVASGHPTSQPASGTYKITVVTVTAPGKSGGGALDLWALLLLAAIYFRKLAYRGRSKFSASMNF